MRALASTGADRDGEAAAATERNWGPWALGFLFLAAGYAAFAGGAIEIPAETRVQVAIALAVPVVVAGLCRGHLRSPNAPAAWAGVLALALLAAWSAASLLWSVLPDASWLAANRAAVYALAAAIALVAAASTRNAPTVAALALAVLALAVAAYALAGKLAPGLALGPLDLDPGDRFARLREPLGYWNALGLLCVLGAPVTIWLAAARDAAPRYRIGAAVALTLLVLAAALAYSRGAIVAYAIALAVMVAAGPRRLTRLAVGSGAVAVAGPAMLLAFTRRDLSNSEVALSDRIDGGLLLAAVLVTSLLALVLGGRELLRLEGRVSWGARRARRAWLAIAMIGAAVPLALGIALAASDRGFSGEISHRIDELKQPGTTLSNEPERLVSANGSSRYVWWQEALGAWSDRPAQGWGAGSFPTLHYLYRRYEAPARSSHSLPLMLASETGAVGMVLGLGGLALLGGAAAARIRASRGADRSARLALAAAAAAWFTQSLFDWHWEIPGVTLPALIALAVAAAPPAGGASLPRPGRRRAAIAVAAALLAAAGLTASAALPSLSEDARLRSLELAGRGDLEGAAEEAERARDLNPLSADPLFAAAGIAAARRRDAEAEALLAEAAETQPDNWRTHRRLAVARTDAGQSGPALAAWREWARTDPLLFARGRAQIAARLFEIRYPPAASPTSFGTPPR